MKFFFRQWVPLQAEERLQAQGAGKELELKAIQAKRLAVMTTSSGAAIQETRQWVGEQGDKLKQEIQGKKAGRQGLTRRIVKLRQAGWSRLETRLFPERQKVVASWRGKSASFEEHRLNLAIHEPKAAKKKSK